MASLDQLTAMGFSSESASTALAMNNNNFDNALSMLISQASHEEVRMPLQSFNVSDSRVVDDLSFPCFPCKSLSVASQPVQVAPQGSSHSAGAPADPELDTLALALAPNRDALNAVTAIVDKLVAGGDVAQTVLVLNLGSKSLACLKHAAGGTGVLFLEALGYRSRSGFFVSGGAPPPSRLAMARGALTKAMSNEAYVLADVLESSAAAARTEAAASRAAMRKKAPRAEPEAGSGLAGTRLVIHVHASGPGGSGSSSSTGSGSEETPSQVLERRFAPDDLFCDVIHWLGSSECQTLSESHSFELIEECGEAPFWWCHGWQLLDVTMRPPRTLGLEHAPKTLQALELWPSAHLKLTLLPLNGGGAASRERVSSSRAPSSLGGCSASSSASSSSSSAAQEPNALGGGHYLAGRPKPSDIMAAVSSTARFGDGSDLSKGKAGGAKGGGAGAKGGGAGLRGPGAAGAQSAAAAAAEARMAATQPKRAPQSNFPPRTAPLPVPQPSVAPAAPLQTSSSVGAVSELVAMGFSEQAVRSALAQTGGNKERAVELLLR